MLHILWHALGISGIMFHAWVQTTMTG